MCGVAAIKITEAGEIEIVPPDERDRRYAAMKLAQTK